MRILYLIIFSFIITEFSSFASAFLLGISLLALMSATAILYHKEIFNIFKYVDKTNIKSFFLLSVIFVAAFLRTNNKFETTQDIIDKVIYFIIFLIVTFEFYNTLLFKPKKKLDDSFFLRILLVPAFFIIISVIMSSLNFDPLSNNTAGLTYGNSVTAAKLFTLNVQRTGTPLGVGTNNYGLFLGGVLSMALIGIWTMKGLKNKLLMVSLCMLCLFEIIFADTRAALVWPFVSASIAFVLFKIDKINYAKFLIIPVAIMMPILILSKSDLLKKVAVSDLARSSKDAETGNNRIGIWIPCWEEIQDFKPKQIIGYGDYGQKGSGVSRNYGSIFLDQKNAELLSTHNLVFQLFLDTGYLGIIVFYFFVMTLIGKIQTAFVLTGNKSLLMFIAFIFFLFFGGMTEASMSHEIVFYFFWMIAIGIIAIEGYINLIKKKGVIVTIEQIA